MLQYDYWLNYTGLVQKAGFKQSYLINGEFIMKINFKITGYLFLAVLLLGSQAMQAGLGEDWDNFWEDATRQAKKEWEVVKEDTKKEAKRVAGELFESGKQEVSKRAVALKDAALVRAKQVADAKIKQAKAAVDRRVNSASAK